MRVLREVAQYNIVESALYRHFPVQCAELGRPRVRHLILNSARRARMFGFTPAEFRGFASFEMAFGEEFWEKKQYRWARRILEDRDIENPAERYDALRRASIRHLARMVEAEELARAARESELAEAQREERS